jgi:lipopolysaccharide transport system permease protein
VWHQIREVYFYREMLKNLVSKELRARYKGSVLGFLWTFFNPLLMLIVYSVVFSFIMRIETENYAMFLFVALLPWNFLSSSIMQGAASLVQNGSLIKKIYFPREILPLSIVIANLINYLLSLFILIPALIFFKIKITPAILSFPIVLFTMVLLVMSLTLLISIANVYFRDLEHIVSILITAWFFLTPVLYSSEYIPESVRSYFYINPVTHLIEAFRSVFYEGAWPQWATLGYLTLGVAVLFLISLITFNCLQKAVAEEI